MTGRCATRSVPIPTPRPPAGCNPVESGWRGRDVRSEGSGRPTRRRCVGIGLAIDQHLCEAGVQRKFIFRVLRFHAFDATVNDAAGDLDRFPFEIKICWSALVAVRLHSWTIGTSDACTTRPDLWVHKSGIKPVARGVSCPMLSGLNLGSAALACSCCSRTRKQIRRPHSMTKPFKLNIWPIPTKNIEIIKYRNIEA